MTHGLNFLKELRLLKIEGFSAKVACITLWPQIQISKFTLYFTIHIGCVFCDIKTWIQHY